MIRGDMAMNPKQTLEDLVSAVSNLLPEPPAEGFRQNLRAAFRSALDRADLVTREELEIQEAVLRRTREKLEQLEKTVAELEEKLVNK
jgi:BMFP domain-containing protein YqiC